MIVKTVVACAVLAAGVSAAPAAGAEVSASCRLHLERVQQATGEYVSAAQDRRHWAARGQASRYCSEQDESPQAESSHDESKDPGKSRYCRKRWFC